MINMKVRYEIADVNFRISNVNPRDSESYVLMTATDEHNNEISFALSHEQAEHLEDELYETNRRWRTSASARQPNTEAAQAEIINNDNDQLAH